MKKIFFFSTLLIVSTTSFSQQTNPSPTLTKQDYLQKSKHQKMAARICLGGGVLLVLTGVVIAPKDYNADYDINTPAQDHQYHFAEALGFTGFASMLASIPLFGASHRNKKKSMGLSFKSEIVQQLSKQNFIYHRIPSLTLKICL